MQKREFWKDTFCDRNSLLYQYVGGSDRSAAGGGESDLSEWQRSQRETERKRGNPDAGTATGPTSRRPAGIRGDLSPKVPHTPQKLS